uniref:Uncharacterized protein n=1 Tax=Amphimedon queenslandica TaxID=400682 RepID=A0A1X7UZM4_AMPQE
MTVPSFEKMSNHTKFPYGTGGYTTERPFESKQKTAARKYIWQQKRNSNLTAHEARNQAVISENIHNDKVYAFLKSVRGSPEYCDHTFYNLAMVHQLGTRFVINSCRHEVNRLNFSHS